MDIYDEEVRLQVDELCQAIDLETEPFTQLLVHMLDEEEVEKEELMEAYAHWAVPMTQLILTLSAEMNTQEEGRMQDLPGFSLLEEHIPELSPTISLLSKNMEDRETLVLAASSWMAVSQGTDQLLEAISE